MRTWMVAGNWKMHNTVAEAVTLAAALAGGVGAGGAGEVVIAPPFTALMAVGEAVKGSGITLAAQNMYYEEKGAFTGEVSPLMLKDAGCTYVIIGHSERRKYFNETDGTVNLKAKKCLAVGMKPIICVGETLEEREEGVTEFVVGLQVRKALKDIASLDNVVVAYEPVWAIGTGKNATPHGSGRRPPVHTERPCRHVRHGLRRSEDPLRRERNPGQYRRPHRHGRHRRRPGRRSILES